MPKSAHLALRVRGSHSLSAQAAPQQHASFGGIDGVMDTAGPDYIAIASSAEFRRLRLRVRRFVFAMSGLFLTHYLAYVLAAAYLPDFMGISVFGAINLGLLLGIAQFVSTILITVAYTRFATRGVDPMVNAIRHVHGVPA